MAVSPIVDIDRETGEYVSGWPRIRSSIFTILTTRLRTRLMRLWFGSDFLDLQDKPSNEEVFIRSIVAASKAIDDYEPEFAVTSILIENLGPDGAPTITVYGDDLTDGQSKKTRVSF